MPTYRPPIYRPPVRTYRPPRRTYQRQVPPRRQTGRNSIQRPSGRALPRLIKRNTVLQGKTSAPLTTQRFRMIRQSLTKPQTVKITPAKAAAFQRRMNGVRGKLNLSPRNNAQTNARTPVTIKQKFGGKLGKLKAAIKNSAITTKGALKNDAVKTPATIKTGAAKVKGAAKAYVKDTRGSVSTNAALGGIQKALSKLKTKTQIIAKPRPIKFDRKYYSIKQFKISKSYYDRLWRTGRPAPFLQAEHILKSNPKVSTDPRNRPGFKTYSTSKLKMIYNPKTKEIWHIEPRTK